MAIGAYRGGTYRPRQLWSNYGMQCVRLTAAVHVCSVHGSNRLHQWLMQRVPFGRNLLILISDVNNDKVMMTLVTMFKLIVSAPLPKRKASGGDAADGIERWMGGLACNPAPCTLAAQNRAASPCAGKGWRKTQMCLL